MTEPCCGGSTKTKPQPTFISRILDKVFVSDVEKNRRMEICRSCEHFNAMFAQCKICGCFMEAKTRLQGFHCALSKIEKTPLW